MFPGINDVDAREMAGNYDFPPEPEWRIGKRQLKECSGVIKDVKVGHTNPLLYDLLKGVKL